MSTTVSSSTLTTVTTDSGDLINLTTSDGEKYEVPLKVAQMSVTIKNMLEDFGGNTDIAIPLQNISSNALKKVIEYCEYHLDDKEEDEKKGTEISAWDKDFFNVEQSHLFELILAANFLDIKPMLDVTCKTVANIIKGKSPEEIRKTFNIQNDFTPEEEEQVRKENEWCEER
jgi:S-phase kinase-associated protein 1